MGFNFRFDKILRIKLQKEETLQREYYSLMNSYMALMNELVELKKQRDSAIINQKEMEKRGTKAAYFDMIENFLKGNKVQCIDKIVEIRAKRKDLDFKKLELLEATKERKTFDKLKEIEFKKYILNNEIKDVNFADEVATSYYGRVA